MKAFLSQRVMRLTLPLAVVMCVFALAAAPWGAQAVATIRYVDGAGGADTGTCGSSVAPCKTINHTIQARAAPGDSLRVAQGVYLENVVIDKSLEIHGGYQAGSWIFNPAQYHTVIDGAATPFNPGAWDGQAVRYPMVIHDGGLYKMWYTGVDVEGVGRIGYATSPDGIQWDKIGTTPVLNPGGPGSWDEGGLEFAFVRKEGPTSYKMWYSGFGPSGGGIGYATSPNGMEWTPYAGNPVLAPGSQPWNGNNLLHPHVIYEGGMYKMWLLAVGDEGSGPFSALGYATSANGIAWSLNPSEQFRSTWEQWFWNPDVHHFSNYQMWYSVWFDDQASISYAISADGLSWGKHGSPVLVGAVGEWDEGFVSDPFVLYEGGGYIMYYDNGSSGIGRATSLDGIAWTKYGANPVLGVGAPPVWGKPVVRIDNGGATVLLDSLELVNGSGENAGGVDADVWDLTILNCFIHHNRANGQPNAWGGGAVLSNGDVTIGNSRILHNDVKAGAGAVRSGENDLTIHNTLIAWNTGDFAIHTNGSANITHASITHNDRGLLFNSPNPSDVFQIYNSIITHNLGSTIEIPGVGSSHVVYSNVEYGFPGEGNTDLDPVFVMPHWDDFHLSVESQVIDRASPAYASPVDMEGLPRVRGPDMGACEWQGERLYLPFSAKK